MEKEYTYENYLKELEEAERQMQEDALVDSMIEEVCREIELILRGEL